MKNIKKVNTKELVSFYENNPVSLRDVSKKFNIDHHRVKRILENNNIKIEKKKKIIPSEETKNKLSEIMKIINPKGNSWNFGKKMSKLAKYKNMKAHLKYDVELEWLLIFSDINKLMFLNRSITRERDCSGFDTEMYKRFIEKFYYDEQFNTIYDTWKLNETDRYLKPSLDHVTPRANNGKNSVDNFQFLTWLENKAKNDIPQENWDIMKKNINKYFI